MKKEMPSIPSGIEGILLLVFDCDGHTEKAQTN